MTTINKSKQSTLRSEAYRRWVASLPCINCGSGSGSQAAHSNSSLFGKGMGLKASDAAIFPLCPSCHTEHDQGAGKKKGEWLEDEFRWITLTLVRAVNEGVFS